MKKKHAPVYYDIRTAVRFIVWGGLALGLLAGIVSHFSDDTPVCNIRVVSASPPRWEAKGEPVDVSKCVAPQYMVLHNDGSWEWIG